MNDHRNPTKAGEYVESAPKLGSKMFIHDVVVFMTLTLVSLTLYGITTLLFRSFERHRQHLAVHWSQVGHDEMLQGHPEQAAASMRQAVSYSPSNRDYDLLLARALADAGHTDEAVNYFLNLWESTPGDGFINLELARLFRKKGLSQESVRYYHASIFGDWPGDAPSRRRGIRLELSDYLASLHQNSAARAELLIASGNAPDNVHIDLTLGGKFEAMGATVDALNSYKKATVENPHNVDALMAAGRMSLESGDYEAARQFLDVAGAQTQQPGELRDRVLAMKYDADRLFELSTSDRLPAKERAEHLLLGKTIAEKRFDACSKEPGAATSPAMMGLKSRWSAVKKTRADEIEVNPTLEIMIAGLIRDAEIATSVACGPPSGDDAFLLKLARQPNNE
jgi:tetratricopeptide (TPR) repeat protein